MGGGADGFSDEFDDSATISAWTLGPSDAFDAFDIDTTTPDHLTVTSSQYALWQDDGQGFFLYKMVTGDFALRVRTSVEALDDPGMVPTEPFHSAGILARDPASDGGSENWISYELGKQNAVVSRGTRSAKTTTSDTDFDLTASGNNQVSGVIVMCRLGGTIHLLRKLDGEADWTETQTHLSVALPDEVQLGVAANAGYGANPNLKATFDYARFVVPTTLADCTAGM
jgi:hypothetical protein